MRAAGAVGILLSGLVLGWLGRACRRWGEEHFGGYLIGGVAFNGLISIFWRVNCWEFLLNPVMWSLVLAWALHHLSRICGWITPRSRTPPALLHKLSAERFVWPHFEAGPTHETKK
jgi:hypothetical protein